MVPRLLLLLLAASAQTHAFGGVRTATRRLTARASAAVAVPAAAASALTALADVTVISIDSGDLDVIAKWAETGLITDATTNPLFVAQAGTSGDARYVAFVDAAVAYAKENAAPDDVVELAMDRLAVLLGLAIVKLVPGYVSTEVDIRASFDTKESLRRARRIIKMYEAEGVDRSRVLVKLAGTWEGIRAAAELEAEGITCNITLIFGFIQAVAAAQAKARLISPFPGRIKDWVSANGGSPTYEPDEDPGVVSVRRMHAYFKKYGHDKTIVMPASWRPSRGTSDPVYAVDEILALQGVDRMTMPAAALALLASLPPQPTKLDAISAAAGCADAEVKMTESSFRLALTQDVAATTKLAEGINSFIAETQKLEAAIRAKI
ncbi:hypothetical protein M885DRAFT_542632 [Pelagophyceae sp. CCMP2097]|nr:hypothetical protein M885DRAFT_542632 [Pelagophyceae sp. CCMP2097]